MVVSEVSRGLAAAFLCLGRVESFRSAEQEMLGWKLGLVTRGYSDSGSGGGEELGAEVRVRTGGESVSLAVATRRGFGA